MRISGSIFKILCFTAVFSFVVSVVPVDGKLEPKSSVTLDFQSYVGNELLKLERANYKNEVGQSFTISRFKYYISNVRLKRDDGKEYVSEGYFLVNHEKPESTTLLLEGVEEGNYVSLSFILGVDSLRNCSGVQSGALDPMLGMFWAWNTGYIFLKLEGHSPESKSTGKIFEYHVGGFREPNNAIRKIDLPLKDGLNVMKGNNSVVKIKADAGEILKSPVTIDFSVLSSVTDFNNATLMADNYKDMFSVIEIKQEVFPFEK